MSGPASARWGGAPVALVLGLGASLGLGVVFQAMQSWIVSSYAYQDALFRWMLGGLGLAWRALSPAVTVLVIAGLLDLRRRVGPRAGRALVASLAGAAVLLVLPFVVVAFDLWRKPLDRAALDQLAQARAWIAAGAALAVSGGLIAAGWERARVRALAAPLLVLTALAYAAPPVRELVDLGGARTGAMAWVQLLIDRALHAGFTLLALACAAAIAAERAAPVRWSRAAAGLRRTGTALVARVVIAVVSASTLILAVAGKTASLLTTAMWAMPLASAVATIAMISGLVQAAGLVATGAPRVRLYVAAGLVTWVAAVQLIQAAALLRVAYLEHGREDMMDLVAALPYAQPLATLAALLCVLAALGALARSTDRAVPELGTAATLTTASGFAILLVNHALYDGGGLSSRSGLVLWLLVLAVAQVVGQLLVARACQRTAEALEAMPELPVATLAER